MKFKSDFRAKNFPKVQLIFVFLIALFCALEFQNCNRMPFTYAGPSIDSIGTEHPSTVSQPEFHVASNSAVLMDKVQLQEKLKAIFGIESTAYDSMIDFEILPNQHLLGRPCNPYEDGDLARCISPANASLAMTTATSAGREATKIQICRRLASRNELINQLAISVSTEKEVTPSENSMQNLILRFYPGLENDHSRLEHLNELKQSLLDLDQQMAENSERADDRWRILFLTVCETADWQTI